MRFYQIGSLQENGRENIRYILFEVSNHHSWVTQFFSTYAVERKHKLLTGPTAVFLPDLDQVRKTRLVVWCPKNIGIYELSLPRRCYIPLCRFLCPKPVQKIEVQKTSWWRPNFLNWKSRKSGLFLPLLPEIEWKEPRCFVWNIPAEQNWDRM